MGRLFTIPNDKQKDYARLIGFYSSEDMDVMIILLSLLRKSSKSFLLRYIMNWYFKKQRVTIEKLYNSMAEKSFLKYTTDFKQSGERDVTLEAFKKQLKYDLKSRNIPDKYVEEVIKKFDERTKAQYANETESK